MLQSRALFIVNLKKFLIRLTLKNLLSHDETETHKVQKNFNAKVRLGTESESSYSMTNSRNLKEVLSRNFSFVALAAFKNLHSRAISLSITSAKSLS